MSNDCILKTKTLLQSVITKPKLTDSLLKKPPFRFLYDIIFELASVTGFCKDLFLREEFRGDKVKGKEGKIAFLVECIQRAESVVSEKIDVNPQKVVSGMEFEKTNLFIQIFASAALSSGLPENSVPLDSETHEFARQNEDDVGSDPENLKHGLSDIAIPENGGRLVNQIFGMHSPSSNISAHDRSKSKDSSMSEDEMDSPGKKSTPEQSIECQKIREYVQSTSKIIVPLGKCVDYIHEDMDSMNNEVKLWMREIHIPSKNESEMPDVSEAEAGALLDIDSKILAEQLSIANLRSAICHNDELISSMMVDGV